MNLGFEPSRSVDPIDNQGTVHYEIKPIRWLPKEARNNPRAPLSAATLREGEIRKMPRTKKKTAGRPAKAARRITSTTPIRKKGKTKIFQVTKRGDERSRKTTKSCSAS